MNLINVLADWMMKSYDSTARDFNLCDAGCYAPDHSHPLSVLRDDDGHHERRRDDYFERREVDFLL